MSYEAAALFEPLSVGIASAQKAGGITAGSRVLIAGAGPVGIVTTQVAKHSARRKSSSRTSTRPGVMWH